MYQGGAIRWTVTNAAGSTPGVSAAILYETQCDLTHSRPACDGNGGQPIGGGGGAGGVDVYVGVTETTPWGTSTEYHYIGGGCRDAVPGCTGTINRPNVPLGAEILCVARDQSAAVCSSSV